MGSGCCGIDGAVDGCCVRGTEWWWEGVAEVIWAVGRRLLDRRRCKFGKRPSGMFLSMPTTTPPMHPTSCGVWNDCSPLANPIVDAAARPGSRVSFPPLSASSVSKTTQTQPRQQSRCPVWGHPSRENHPSRYNRADTPTSSSSRRRWRHLQKSHVPTHSSFKIL